MTDLPNTRATIIYHMMTDCPICGAPLQKESSADDWLPDGQIVERRFTCGAALAITEDGRVERNSACPMPIDEWCEYAMEHADETVTQAEDAGKTHRKGEARPQAASAQSRAVGQEKAP